jgi:hypothetical protein
MAPDSGFWENGAFLTDLPRIHLGDLPTVKQRDF